MVRTDCIEVQSVPSSFGFTAHTKANVVVNKKRKVVRVPKLLHLMSIRTQRDWCRRNCVEFVHSPKRARTTAHRTLAA
jgi:hypothetical protein